MAKKETELIEDEITEVEIIEDEIEELSDSQSEEELPPEDESELADEAVILASQVIDSTTPVESEDAALLSDENLDKVEEYFRLKGVMRTLRNDLKDHKAKMEDNQELEKLNKRVKELREKVKDDETVKALTEKMQTSKERLELVKELIRIELLETAKEEIKRNGRKLKLVHILKEMKDQDDAKKGGKKPFRGGSIFRN